MRISVFIALKTWKYVLFIMQSSEERKQEAEKKSN